MANYPAYKEDLVKRLLFICCLILSGAGATRATGACDDGMVAVSFTLELAEDRADLRSLLLSTSRVAEQQGQCWRSLARLDANLETDLGNFRRVLRSEGYYAASLDYRAARTSGAVDLHVVVQPGMRYTIEDVQVTTAQDALQDGAAIVPQLRAGAPARSADIVQAEINLVTTLGETGYPFAEASERQVTVNHDTQKVSVIYALTPGPFVRFGEVEFAGLERADVGYLKRLVPWEADERFSWRRLNEFRTRLMATALFRTASVSVGRPAPGENSVTVYSTIEELPAHRLELGGGYSTGEGFDLEAAIIFRNAWGRGENL
jgi:translocation and assembly module TamA